MWRISWWRRSRLEQHGRFWAKALQKASLGSATSNRLHFLLFVNSDNAGADEGGLAIELIYVVSFDI